MADPLSITGSVVGITAAGVRVSVKLYALAEKVATASQRVTSIADDISSTCAILNQVRELIIPQPDAQGTLKSVFNSVALIDISRALRHCRSSFTETETLLRRAFEQVGKRPALHSKIELSPFEKAKWPFLQPQFDEVRNDLRDAKSNLVLMIAVASLALAQRDGRQRPIHETERLELGSTIVQLQRASTVKTRSERWNSHVLYRHKKFTKPHSSLDVDAPGPVSSRSGPGGTSLPQRVMAHSPSYPQDPHVSYQTIPQEPTTSTPSFEATAVAQCHEEQSQETLATANDDETAAVNDDVTCLYSGWTSTYLRGLATGHGDSLLIDGMELPHASLEKLVKTYTDEGNDPHIALSELTRQQRAMIKDTLPVDGWVIAFVRSQRNTSVSTVFGTLNVETLKWITRKTILRAQTPSVQSRGSHYAASSCLYSHREAPCEKDSSPQDSPCASTPDVNGLRPAPRVSFSKTPPSQVDDLLHASDDPTPASPPAEQSTHPTVTFADAPDEVQHPSAAPKPIKRRIGRQRQPPIDPGPPFQYDVADKPNDYRDLMSRPEENGEDIVKELLARWTVS